MATWLAIELLITVKEFDTAAVQINFTERMLIINPFLQEEVKVMGHWQLTSLVPIAVTCMHAMHAAIVVNQQMIISDQYTAIILTIMLLKT